MLTGSLVELDHHDLCQSRLLRKRKRKRRDKQKGADKKENEDKTGKDDKMCLNVHRNGDDLRDKDWLVTNGEESVNSLTNVVNLRHVSAGSSQSRSNSITALLRHPLQLFLIIIYNDHVGSVGKLPTLMKNTCYRCLRRVWEIPFEQCNAIFESDGSINTKCINYVEARKDYISVGFYRCFLSKKHRLTAATDTSQLPQHRGILARANRLIIMRVLYERSARRGWDPNHPQFCSRRRIEEAAKAFNTRLMAVQRVLSRFGGPKLPISLFIEVEKAKSLREIASSLVGIHDTLRYIVGAPKLPVRPRR